MNSDSDPNLPHILPPGTAVVSKTPAKAQGGSAVVPAGTVGCITQSPADDQHSYRVRFADGQEAMLRREDLL